MFPGKDGNSKNVMRIALATEADKLVIAPEQGREAQPRGWRMIAGAVRDEAGTPVPWADRSDLVFPGWHGEEHRGSGYQEWVLVDDGDSDESER